MDVERSERRHDPDYGPPEGLELDAVTRRPWPLRLLRRLRR